MGDSILASLSVPPSGRIPSNEPTGANNSAVHQSDRTQTKDKTAFITPVIGLICNEDVPAMIRTLPASSKDATDKHLQPKEKFTVVKQKPKEGEEQVQEERNASKRSTGMKRKQPDERQSESDEEEEVSGMTSSGEERITRRLRSGASRLRQDTADRRTNESKEDKAVRDEECSRAAALETCMTQLGVKTLHLPEDPSLRSMFVSCLSRQPRVIIEKLSENPANANRTDGGGKSLNVKQQNQRRKSSVKSQTRKSNQHQKPDLDFPGLDNKE